MIKKILLLALTFCLALANGGVLNTSIQNFLGRPITLSVPSDNIDEKSKGLDMIYEDFYAGLINDWLAYNPNVQWVVEKGVLKVYNITNTEEGRLWYLYLKDYSFDEDILIDLDFKILEGGVNARVGLIVGLDSDGSFFRFRVDVNGRCDFYLHNEEPFEWHKLAESKMRPLVIDKWYRMRVVVQQDKVSFYVDGTPVLDLYCGEYHFKVTNNGQIISEGDLYETIKGRIGIYAVEAKVHFKNFYCKKLIPAPLKKYGIANLRKDLQGLRWLYQYKANEFDCSNMSLILGYFLRELGWRCFIAAGDGHAWLLVETSSGVYTPVEATSIYIRSDWPKYREVGTLEEMQKRYPWDYNFPYEGPYLCRR
ncbi:MAG: family 16 glycoside hydrolase [candidate division WOR-3 bacterium]